MGVCGCCTLPSREGLGKGGLHGSRSSEPVSWPTALKIPPQVPLTQDGGAAGGSAVGRLAHALPPRRGSKPCGRCGSLSGATAAAIESSPDPRSGGTAAGVTPSGPKGGDWRAGRAGPNTSGPTALQRPGIGLGGRSEGGSGRCAAHEVQRCERSTGQFVKRSRRSRAA